MKINRRFSEIAANGAEVRLRSKKSMQHPICQQLCLAQIS